MSNSCHMRRGHSLRWAGQYESEKSSIKNKAIKKNVRYTIFPVLLVMGSEQIFWKPSWILPFSMQSTKIDWGGVVKFSAPKADTRGRSAVRPSRPLCFNTTYTPPMRRARGLCGTAPRGVVWVAHHLKCPLGGGVAIRWPKILFCFSARS